MSKRQISKYVLEIKVAIVEIAAMFLGSNYETSFDVITQRVE